MKKLSIVIVFSLNFIHWCNGASHGGSEADQCVVANGASHGGSEAAQCVEAKTSRLGSQGQSFTQKKSVTQFKRHVEASQPTDASTVAGNSKESNVNKGLHMNPPAFAGRDNLIAMIAKVASAPLLLAPPILGGLLVLFGSLGFVLIMVYERVMIAKKLRPNLPTESPCLSAHSSTADINSALHPVQFSSDIYYINEGEKEACIDIVRSGDVSGECSVCCYTSDHTAVADKDFERFSSEIVFAALERERVVSIKMLSDDDVWEPTSEFDVVLRDPKNCRLGEYQNKCRIKVIDDDFFPSNQHREAIERNEIDGIPLGSLAWGFVKFAFSQPTVPRRAITIMLIGLAHNLHYLLTLHLKVYLVNILLPNAAGDDVEKAHFSPLGRNLLIPNSLAATSFVIGLLYLVPFGLLHALDVYKATLGVSGDLRRLLQNGLFRKYLHYSASSREKVKDAEISIASVQDSGALVSNGFMKMFQFTDSLTKLIIVCFFLITSNVAALVPLSIFPVLAFIWLKVRWSLAKRTSDELSTSQVDMVDSVHKTCRDYELIWDYHQRSPESDRHYTRITKFNNALSASSLINLNNGYFFPWLTTISMAAYVVFGVSQIAAGNLTSGTFIATFGIFKDVGDELQGGYKDIMLMIDSFGLLRGLTKLLNLPDDAKQRLINRQRRVKHGQSARQELARKYGEQTEDMRKPITPCAYAEDTIKIELSDLTYSYICEPVSYDGMDIREPVSDDVLNIRDLVFDGVNISVDQGKIVAVFGTERRGKATLMRLLAQTVLPQKGYVFVPPHLRILDVQADPHILDASLIVNLTYGSLDKSDLAEGRIRKICESLGFRAELLEQLKNEFSSIAATASAQTDNQWRVALTRTDRMLIHLARAFVYNPNVLILHRPFMRFFSADLRERLFATMREFVSNGGVGLPVDPEARRNRTLFFSACRSEEMRYADITWRIEGTNVEEVPAHEVETFLREHS